MLVGARQRLESTLVASRPRTALAACSFFHTSTCRRNQAAQAALQVEPQITLMSDYKQPKKPQSQLVQQMGGFLRRGIPPVKTPTISTASSDHKYWFLDAATQDSLGILDACLGNLYDVPRAKALFDRMRKQKKNPTLESKLYNRVMEAYAEMAEKPEEKREYWLEEILKLWEEMVNESEFDDERLMKLDDAERAREIEAGRRIAPTQATYALMLRLHLRYNPCVYSLLLVYFFSLV
jgi:hypothetical protein